MTLALKQSADLVLEFVLDVVRFPWWWYSGGLTIVAERCWRGFSTARARVSLGVFARYLFKPMYQDYTWQGRAISLAMRLVLLIAKSIRLLVAAAWYLAFLVGWVLLLPVTLFILFS
ncbi:MAG: hypothetical protein U1C53_02895 [Candidatus Veblenbacteria bacterium]|nr:hypothetical protein [Candidatus Veblenbacteria bacterium]MDZ4230062.1 hypothetical protein [Candidatus Veblenbacteria bacterium]